MDDDVPVPDDEPPELSIRRAITLSDCRQSVTESLWTDSDVESLKKLKFSSAYNSTDDLILEPRKEEKASHPSRHVSRTRRTLEYVSHAVAIHPFIDTEWQVALASLFGSLIWITSSLFSFLPYAVPSSRFPGETEYCVGILSSVGSIFFFISSVRTILHTLNDSRATYFGWALQQARNEYRADRNLYNKNWRAGDFGWCPTFEDVKSHFVHDLAFRACCVQLVCSMLFLWSGICAIPIIYDNISTSREMLNAVYWSPKVVACCGFIYIGILTTIHAQRSSLTPCWRKLSWYGGIFSTFGGIAFLLMSCFGFGTADWMQWQCRVAAMWGSCLFLFASILGIWEQSFKRRHG